MTANEPPVAAPQRSDGGARGRLIWISGLCIASALILAALSWAARFRLGTDTVSFLDVADQLRAHDFSALLHPYWSPLYPCLLTLAATVFSATPANEAVIVHVTDFLAALGGLAAFTFLVVEWLQTRGSGSESREDVLWFRLKTSFAYVAFLCGSCRMIQAGVFTADLCLAGIVYLAAGLVLRLQRQGGGITISAVLGLALSLGYLTKAVMLPLGLVLIGILTVMRWAATEWRRKLLVTGTVFLTISGAYVSLLSLRQHRLTFGDTGRLNYAWNVSREVPDHVGWLGEEPGSGPPASSAAKNTDCAGIRQHDSRDPSGLV